MLPEPTNQRADVLYRLIKRGELSERESNMNGFRARISELIRKHNLTIQYRVQQFHSRYGKKSYYKVHYIPPDEKERAIEIYNQINN